MKDQSIPYLVVATKSWNYKNFRDIISQYTGDWTFI